VLDNPTKESIAAYKSEFGDDYFSFWVNGCKFIAINSQFYLNSEHVPDERKAQEDWLNSELTTERDAKEKEAKHKICFQHVPPFVNNFNELSSGYFNFEHKERKAFLDKLVDGGVSKLFCGHLHHNNGGFYRGLEVIVTSAVGCQIEFDNNLKFIGPGKTNHGYRIVKVTENDVEHEYISISNRVN
jgi:serine/threonine-protein phosphatase CPPED1